MVYSGKESRNCLSKNNDMKENLTPFFSIVVCTYNGAEYIQRCLKSLKNQTLDSSLYEIIVVNDGSTDKTAEIVKKFHVQLVNHKQNKGIAAARNSGLQQARGKVYVCFDDDCYVNKNWLETIYKVYQQYENKNISGVSGRILLPDKQGILNKYLQESGYGNPSSVQVVKNTTIFSRFFAYIKNMFGIPVTSNENVFEVGEIWGANCSFTTHILKSVGGWNEHLTGVEDTDVCDRIKKKYPKRKFLCAKEAILYHDRAMSVRDFLSRPYKRSKVIYTFYKQNNKIPPIFPFPLVTTLLTIIAFAVSPLLGVMSLIVLPPLMYSWWIIKATRERKPLFILFSFIQYAYELCFVIGLFQKMLQSTLTKERKVLLGLLTIGFIVNILTVRNLHFLLLGETLTTLFLLLVPGLLFSWMLGLAYKTLWEGFSYTIGISIIALMLLGLGINSLFLSLPMHILSAAKPLTLGPILLYLNIFLGSMWLYAYIRNKQIPFPFTQPSLSLSTVSLSLTALIFPAMAILGAISLNNNSSNIFTLLMLLGIGIFITVLCILREKVGMGVFIWTIFLIAISLLFMTSLRGWYITGHDINLEYFVFQLTKEQGLWKMSNFQDPYNACISITILPTIFSLITHIPDAYIYKVLYQIIFATSLVTTYLFIRKFINNFLAFLGTFVIVSLPTFMTDMPFLNRQEIALLFFALLLNTLFTKHFSKRIIFFLFTLFSIGMLISHYSTTYLAVILFIGAYLLNTFLTVLTLHNKVKNIIHKLYKKLGVLVTDSHLHIGMVIILLIATIVWNVNITNTSTGIVKTVSQIWKNLHTPKTKTVTNSYQQLSGANNSPQMILSNYVTTTTTFVRKFNDNSAFLDKTIYTQYPVTLAHETTDSLTSFGLFLKKIHISVFLFNDALKQVYAKAIQLFIIVGFAAIFFLKKHITNFEKEYLVLTTTFFAILVVQLVLPSGSVDYGILRLFQQGMILFAVPLIMGGLGILSIFDRLHASIKIYGLTFIFVFFFLYLSGFIPQVTGGYYPQLNVSNGGFYYNAYYTHTTDIASMQWLAAHRDTKIPIQSDWFTLNRIHAYEKFYSIDFMIPSTIRVNSYVYLSTFNTTTKDIIEYIGANPLYYTYNFKVLDDNKNLIYSNGSSKIYR